MHLNIFFYFVKKKYIFVEIGTIFSESAGTEAKLEFEKITKKAKHSFVSNDCLWLYIMIAYKGQKDITYITYIQYA